MQEGLGTAGVSVALLKSYCFTGSQLCPKGSAVSIGIKPALQGSSARPLELLTQILILPFAY